jgi:hypothetical protein
MQTLAGKAAVGLPSLTLKPRVRAKQVPAAMPRLQRTWTLRSSPGTAAALPFPFMEISVSVLDTIDLMRSSLEEEVRGQCVQGPMCAGAQRHARAGDADPPCCVRPF